MEPCRYLEWDSEFFGKRIGSVNGNRMTPKLAEDIEYWCEERAIDCLYFLADPDDLTTTRLAGEHGFRLVDIRLTLGHEGSPSAKKASMPVRPATPSDVAVLAQMARENHNDSRFFFDPGFPREACEDLYETWMRRSCEGYADAVFVVDFGERAGGYVTCHREDGDVPAHIGLLGVGSDARGQGAGEALLRAAVKWLSAQSSRVTVVTQGRNLAAQRLYQRSGFVPLSLQLWYHWWRSGTDRGKSP